MSGAADGGLWRPLLATQGSTEQRVMVMVQCGDDFVRDQAKQQIAQALKGSSEPYAYEPAAQASSEELHSLWKQQGAMLAAWLFSSVVAAVFAPMLLPNHPALLPALTAAALGLVGPMVHLFSSKLAASQWLSLSDQISLVTATTLTAGCVDLLAMAMTVGYAWTISSGAATITAVPDMRPLLMFAFTCWQHGVVAVAVMHSVSSLEDRAQEGRE